MNSISLPKWPQMCVSGSKIDVQDAKEIIFRTDRFFSQCYGENTGTDNIRTLYQKAAGIFPSDHGIAISDYGSIFELQDKIHSVIGFIYEEYLINDWGLSSFIWGPHGWCHPNGVIQFDDNIGKWPTVDEVVESWTRMALEFPFLDLVATLMSGESCEENTVPLVDIIVQNGAVTAEESNDLRNHQRFLQDKFPFHRNDDDDHLVIDKFPTLGVSLEWYSEFAIKVRKSLGLKVDWDAIDKLNEYLAETWSE